MRRSLTPLAAVILLVLAAASSLACAPPPDNGPATDREVWWPKFPFDPSSRTDRVLAVLYSTDNIGPNTTLAQMGYPGRGIFRLHEDHPRIKVVLMSCPANRYSGDRSVLDSPRATASWKALAKDPKFDWIELGNQGYTHSPPGDSNLNHHEFSTVQTGCNLDHAELGKQEYVNDRMDLIRSTYGEMGIAPEDVALIRFPGMADSPEALQAAARAGFLASLGRRNAGKPDRVEWVPDASGEEILEIAGTRLLRLFASSPALEEDLAAGRVTRGQLLQDRRFIKAVKTGAGVVDRAAAGGGILNLTDRWSETFKSFSGHYPRYRVLDAVLDDLEARYGSRVWYPRGRELALWLTARRRAALSHLLRSDGIDVTVTLPESWTRFAGEGLELASLMVAIPPSWKRIRTVELRDEGGDWLTLDPSSYWLERRGLAVAFPLRGSVQLRITRDGA